MVEVTQELKPCPFCNGIPGVMCNAVNGTYVHYVMCACKARAAEFVGGFEATIKQAIAAWNNRPAEHAAHNAAIEAAAAECRKQQQDFLSPQYAVGQPISSFSERFACSECAAAILALRKEQP